MTAVRIQTSPARCSVAFGSYSVLQPTKSGNLALFAAEKVVAYYIQYSPHRALYLFRTSPLPGSATRLRGVSQPVNLLYVASTRRTVEKTTIALRFLDRQVGPAAIDSLPDIFWFRLADCIERRGWTIVPYVTDLLALDATG